MKDETSKHVKAGSGIVVERIEIGAQLMPGNSTIDSSLDFQNSLSRDPSLLPLGDGVCAHSKSAGEFSLRQDLQDRSEGTVLHLSDYVHRRLISVNHRLMAGRKPMVDHKQMVDTPRPEHYGNVADWLGAVIKARKIPKRALAEICGKSPQAVTKWFKGGNIDPEPLEKLATWAGTEYATLRLLLDKQPMPASRRTKGIPALKTPAALRIARKLDMLEGDDDSLELIEELVDNRLSRNARTRKQA